MCRSGRAALVLAASVGVGLLFVGLVVGLAAVRDLGRRDPARTSGGDWQTFCDLIWDGQWYRYALTVRISGTDAQLAAHAAAVAKDMARVVEQTPPAYQASLREAAEGRARWITGDLTEDEAQAYIDAFGRLQRRAAGDCEPYWNEGFD